MVETHMDLKNQAWFRKEGEWFMLKLFQEVVQKRAELENLLLRIRAEEIIYRQKNEIAVADQFKELESKVSAAIQLLVFPED